MFGLITFIFILALVLFISFIGIILSIIQNIIRFFYTIQSKFRRTTYTRPTNNFDTKINQVKRDFILDKENAEYVDFEEVK